MNPLALKKPSIVVIGSAHMDVLADYSAREKRHVDKEGEVYCSIGGTAFNIAVDIANEGGVVVSLYTHVRKRSPVTDIILARLKDEGVSTKYVFQDTTIQKDSGFIAHRADGELVSAVSSMPVEDALFDESTLSSAISHSTVTVADCNLSDTQLALVSRLCMSHHKRLIVAGVSESKCQRIKILTNGGFLPVCFLSVNAKEATALFGKVPDCANPAEVMDTCRIVNASHVIVTDGPAGWTLFSSGGTAQKFCASNVPNVRSTSGAGDALIAAVAHYLASHDTINWHDLKKQIHRFVGNVLRKRVASGADLTNIETLGSSYKRQILDSLQRPSYRVGAIAAGVIAFLGLSVAVVQTAISLETSTKVAPVLTHLYCAVMQQSSRCPTTAAEPGK